MRNKLVNFLDVNLNLTTRKYQLFNKPDNNLLYIAILSNHPPNMIKNPPCKISKRINSRQQIKQHLISLKFFLTMHRRKVNLNIRSHFTNRKIYPQYQRTPKTLYGLTHHTVLMFQQILGKNSSAKNA